MHRQPRYSFGAVEIARVLPRLKRSHFDLNGLGTIYLRLALRSIDGNGLRTLDLADITIKESERRKGVFSSALDVIEIAARLLECDAVYVESISNPIVGAALERRHYTLCLGFVVGEACALNAYKPTLTRSNPA